MLWLLCGFIASLATAAADSTAIASDPLDSSMWREMHERLLDGAPVVFDDRIKVIAPMSAEDSLNVPVKVDASALDDVRRIVVFADFNPIPRILEFEPLKASAAISFNFKVQQATPLHAAALDANGLWHVGGVLLDASGGGCTQPSVGSASDDWADQLGSLSARLWPRDKGQRLRLRIMHPMDTGLAPSIPAFYIERVEINDEQGGALAKIRLFEPVSENPTLTLDLPETRSLAVFARDNNGNRVSARVLP
jgi:sulfur-oxidizing protein SoxY